MTNVAMFHHALGATPGLRAIANELREAGHDVTMVDLFDGNTFETIEAGVAYAEKVGLETIIERGGKADAERGALPSPVSHPPTMPSCRCVGPVSHVGQRG